MGLTSSDRMTFDIRIKRVYEPAAEPDGQRVLVDRVWPRGISKDKAALTLWLKDIAPSNELRTWFDHKAERWDVFRKRYFEELDGKAEALRELGNLPETARSRCSTARTKSATTMPWRWRSI
jgi:uncharacterized protein YeaO (DUF488 family)